MSGERVSHCTIRSCRSPSTTPYDASKSVLSCDLLYIGLSMSLNSSREKNRLFSRGSSTFSLETPKDPIPLDRSISTTSSIGQSLSSSSSTRSEPMLLPMTKRSDFLPSVKPAKPWFSTHESTDVLFFIVF